MPLIQCILQCLIEAKTNSDSGEAFEMLERL